MTDEQVAYIAQEVAKIYKKASGQVDVLVVPPTTAASGHLDFAFVTRQSPLLTGEEDTVKVRFLR